MFTVRDLTNRFGVGERTILLWVASGQLKAVNVARNPRSKRPSWRFREADVSAFEAVRTGGPVEQPSRHRKRAAESAPEFIK